MIVDLDVTAGLLPDGFWPIEVPWGGILYHEGRPVRVKMWWTDRDPYAVTFEFYNGRMWVPWRFDRDLLVFALIGPVTHRELMGQVGEGDVRMELWDSALIVTLDSPSGHAKFLFDPDLVADFLWATNLSVKIGTEPTVDWDAGLDRLVRFGRGWQR